MYGSNGIIGSHDEALVKEPTIVIGRKGAVGEAHLAEQGCWPIDTTFYTVYRQPGAILLTYLLLWFRNIDLGRLAITATVPGLNRTTLYEQQVPVPSTREQERIVGLMNEAEGLRKLRRQADSRSAEFIPALFDGMFGNPQSAPPVVKLEDAIQQFIDYRGKTPTKSSSGVPLVTARIIKAGRILPANEFVSEETYQHWMTRGLPRRGDVVFTTEAPLGEVAIIDTPRIALAQRILLMRPRPDLLDSQYFATALKLPIVWAQIEARANSTTVRGIRQAEIRKVQIPIPPLALQKHFATRVTEIRRLEMMQIESRSGLDALLQSMLDRAFRGEL